MAERPSLPTHASDAHAELRKERDALLVLLQNEKALLVREPATTRTARFARHKVEVDRREVVTHLDYHFTVRRFVNRETLFGMTKCVLLSLSFELFEPSVSTAGHVKPPRLDGETSARDYPR